MTAALPIVLAALHTQIVPPLVSPAASHEERAAWLAEELCNQLADVLAAAPDASWQHVVCTTSLSTLLTGSPATTAALFDRVEQRCGVRPFGLLQQYQCVGWGYALRFAGRHANCRRLAISIVDADVHDTVAKGFGDIIGQVGFGVSTVGIELPPEARLPQCAGPYPNRAFNDLLHALRALHRQDGRRKTFMPFLPEGLAGLAERLIGTDALAPNRHAHYGHCFGSDPWIGLIEWLRSTALATDETVTLGAFAYDGYYTLSNVVVGPSTRVGLRRFAPSSTLSPCAPC